MLPCVVPDAQVFEGKVSGSVVPPRAPSATVEAEGSERGEKEAFLGVWQEIFAPNGASSDGKTLAQMEDAEKAQYLPRRRAISALEVRGPSSGRMPPGVSKPGVDDGIFLLRKLPRRRRTRVRKGP